MQGQRKTSYARAENVIQGIKIIRCFHISSHIYLSKYSVTFEAIRARVITLSALSAKLQLLLLTS